MEMNLIKKKKKKGFTLIELIVVIAILGILAAIAVPRLTTVQTSAKIKAHNANVRMLEGAVSTYEAQEGSLPDTIEDLKPEYINEVPINPIVDGDEYTLDNATGLVSPPQQ